MFAKICMRKNEDHPGGRKNIVLQSIFHKMYFSAFILNLSIPLLLVEFIPGTNIIPGVRAV